MLELTLNVCIAVAMSNPPLKLDQLTACESILASDVPLTRRVPPRNEIALVAPPRLASEPAPSSPPRRKIPPVKLLLPVRLRVPEPILVTAPLPEMAPEMVPELPLVSIVPPPPEIAMGAVIL